MLAFQSHAFHLLGGNHRRIKCHLLYPCLSSRLKGVLLQDGRALVVQMAESHVFKAE